MSRILAWTETGWGRVANVGGDFEIIVQMRRPGVFRAVLVNPVNADVASATYRGDDWAEALDRAPDAIAEAVMEDAEDLRDLILGGGP